MDLPNLIRKIRDDYLWTAEAKSYEHINSGLCEDFAVEVMQHLPDGLHTEEVADVSVASFLKVDESEDDPYRDGRPFDRELLRKHWPSVKPPPGFSWDDLNELSADASFGNGTHVWLTYEKMHFDAECPDGVANIFDLPFFQRVLAGWREEQAAAPAMA